MINALVFSKLDSMDRYVLDGYPRRVDQAEKLGERVDVVIFIDVVWETCIQRICGRNEGRKDDNEDTAAKRYAIYKASTEPILSFYREQGKLWIVDGVAGPDRVFARIEEIISGN